MTPSEVEAMLENLNTRANRIEQILPTLATKDDLKNGLAAALAESKQFTMPLYEDVKSRFELLAEHLANVPTEIRELREKVAVIPELRDDIRLLTENLARVSTDLGDKIGQLSKKLDERPRRR